MAVPSARTTFITYDANGHTLSKTETGAGIVTQYQYDITERLTAVSKTDQNGTTPLGQYRYDPFGRRVRKVSQSETLYFHYDDTGLLAEYDAQGNLVREYQYTPGSTWMTKPLFLRDVQTGKVHYYYNSHLGQPLKLFDRQGRTTWEARSQAFGGLLVVVEEVENRLRFPGQYFDGESGLYHNFHRDYDPKTGMYLQRDPIGLRGGINPRAYSGANPVSRIDPLGLSYIDQNCEVINIVNRIDTKRISHTWQPINDWREIARAEYPGAPARKISEVVVDFVRYVMQLIPQHVVYARDVMHVYWWQKTTLTKYYLKRQKRGKCGDEGGDPWYPVEFDREKGAPYSTTEILPEYRSSLEWRAIINKGLINPTDDLDGLFKPFGWY